jgi:ubiquinone/menaquinone biosynthesis C-methylase UbiE
MMKRTHEHSGKSSESILDKNIILKSLKIQAGQVILDAGCGNGYMAKEFARLVGPAGKVYAADIYESSIKQLQAETSGSNIIVRLADITTDTGIERLSVDMVYLSTVLHGFSVFQVEGFLREVKRVLKLGGVLAIVEIDKKDTPFGPPMNIRYSPEELVKTIALKPECLTRVGDYFYMQTFIL